MNDPKQEKLIRDKIGIKILGSGESGSIRIARDIQEKIYFLTLKHTEELGEFREAHKLYEEDRKNEKKKSNVHYEAADILEVFDTLISLGN
ncbi:MAG: hypothetical protein WAW59_07825 [Patescibacteria group bacterium]